MVRMAFPYASNERSANNKVLSIIELLSIKANKNRFCIKKDPSE